MLGVTLKEIINDLLLEEERDSKHYFYFYLNHGLNCLRDLHRKVDGTLKTQKITVLDGSYTAPIPDDCIKINRVFWVGLNGQIIGLSENLNRITLTDNCGNAYRPPLQGFAANWTVDGWYNNHFVDGQNLGGYFGQGGGSIAGDYHINYEANRIEFSSLLAARYLFVEYIGDATPINGQYRVHPYLRPVVKNYISWMSKERKTGVPMAEKMRLKQEYYTSLVESKMEIWGDSQENFNDANSATFYQTPKGY